MACCVAGGVEEVEGAVGEVVVGLEGADLERVGFGEGYFLEFAVAIGWERDEG